MKVLSRKLVEKLLLNSIFKSSERVRRLSTLTALGNTFNCKPGRSLDLGFGEKSGLFGISCLNKPEGFYLLKQNAKDETDKYLLEALNPSRTRKMVTVFDDLSDSLCRVADMAEFVRVAHPTSRFSSAAEDASVTISGVVEELNTNVSLYRALRHVILNGDVCETDGIDDHVAKLFLFDFEQSGIHLDDTKRKRVVQLQEYILHLGSVFMNSSQRARTIHKSNVPQNIHQFFPRDGENLLVNGLFADCHCDQAREAAYKVFLYPDEHQSDILDNLLAFRHELAVLCGFPSFNHRAMNLSLAGSPETVNNFLERLSVEIKHPAEVEFNEMRLAKKQLGSDKDLMPWDVPYFTSYLKQTKYDINSMDFTPYFSIGCCMEGINNLFQKIYGITLEVEKIKSGEVWHSEVQKLAVIHETEGILGYIYCDFFVRSGKPSHDCHFTIRGGRQLANGDYQLPIVVLMLNFPNASFTVPSLLTPSMVENLFHEIGHAMHSMLARTKYQHVTGTRCSTDFAEVPSVLMEYFATDPRVLSTFAKHYKTGESMPGHMLNKLCASKKMFLATELQLQVFYSALDQKLHSSGLSSHSNIDILKEAHRNYYGLPYVPNTAWHLTFGHLVGYGAKYYSYLMSRAVAAWIWHQCFKKDPFSRSVGEKYRREILAHGGGKPAKDLVEDFLNKTVNPENLVSSLITEINESSHS